VQAFINKAVLPATRRLRFTQKVGVIEPILRASDEASNARALYRVMLVEGNPADTRLVRDALAEHPAFTFQVAHFLEIDDALKFLEGDVVDVALLDCLAAGTGDLGGLSRIVAAAPNLPIVMLTNVEDDATGLRMMQHGAQDYLVKGTVNAAMLVRAIRQAIERKAMSDRVRDSEERFTLAVAGAGDGIWDWQIAGDRLFLSPRAEAMLGFDPAEPDRSMASFSRRVHLDDVARFREALTSHLKGETADFSQQARIMINEVQSRWVLMRGIAESEVRGKARRMAGSISDLSNLDAYYDPVTGLPNRTLLIDRLRGILKRRPARGDHYSALLLVHLSGYAATTETLGQAAGNLMVTGVARAIEHAARPGDLVARAGVREIAVILDGIASVEEATAIAGRIHHALLAPILIAGEDLAPEIRMGIVVTTPIYTDPEAVMRDAAAALDAEPAAELPFCVFNPEMRDRAGQRLRMQKALRHAIERDAFRLVYQPIVALDGGALRGFEALLRWDDPEIGPVGPAIFVPIAEENGLIREIGSWVLKTACDQIAVWRDAGLIPPDDDFSVSVNLSGRQLEDPAGIDHLMSIIAESGLPPRHLTLELTESALVGNPERAREALVAIKLMGVSIAMDDFGTGYSSLSYIGRFPFDKLKIDRSFVNTIAAGIASPLLKGIMGLAREIGMHVVAEGVETKEQRGVLAALHCQDAQGWLFGRPVDSAQAGTLLAAASGRSPQARVLPDAVVSDALLSNEILPNGIPANGIPANGIALNGIALNGAAVNGGAVNGAALHAGATGAAAGIDGVQRRLAFIVAADIVGFGRMLVHDEAGTVQAASDLRRVVDPMIVAYRGRILGVAGESYMLEFVNAVDAVSWALAVQRTLAARNVEQPEDRRMEFRIGVNLGGIVVRGHDVSGDGFNIAAGLEALATPGGVCVSGEVHDDVASKLDLHFEDLGAQTIKNSPELIHAYRAEILTRDGPNGGDAVH
jgi:diguanylate cyclase (GGDEF)-like protein